LSLDNDENHSKTTKIAQSIIDDKWYLEINGIVESLDTHFGIDTMNKHPDVPSTETVIIGAGPIGIELAAALKRARADYLHFEAKQIGHTISWWPRNTTFFSTTERIEIAGIPISNQSQARTTGEEYLAYLRSVVEQLDLQIRTYEPVIDIQRIAGNFDIRTRLINSKERKYVCKRIVLAKGDMDKPNLLGIPGEFLSHVSHYFTDVHPFFRRKLLIVGGRNSAVEAALRCWRAGAKVTISYRRENFDPDVVKHWLLPDIQTQIKEGNIEFLPNTLPVEITSEHTVLKSLTDDKLHYISTDFVLLLTGYVADMTLYKLAGVNLLGDQSIPEYDSQTMETNVRGIYIAGTAAAGAYQGENKYTLFIENTHLHVGKIVQHITGKWPDKLGTIPARNYNLSLDKIQSN
jgi:thioredoxin reductase (NADPH)